MCLKWKVLISAVFFILAGCADHGSESAEILPPEGVWYSSEFDSYVVIKDKELLNYTYDDRFSCNDLSTVEIVSFTEDSNLTVRNEFEEFDISFVIADGLLTLEKEGSNLPVTLIKSDKDFDSFNPLCSDPSASGNVTVNIEFDQLPEFVTLNQQGTEVGQVEYSVSITFDMNNSGTVDLGDISLATISFKSDLELPGETSISELKAYLWWNSSDKETTTITEINFAVEDKTLSFNVPLSAHISIASISQGTPIKVKSYYLYGDSGEERDLYPDSGDFTSGLDSSHLVDLSGDVNDGQSIVDIVSIQVSVSNE